MRARVAFGLSVLALVALPGLAQPVATENLSATSLTVTPQVAFEQAILRVSGPGGYVGRATFESGESIQVDLAGFGDIFRKAGDEMSSTSSLDVDVPEGRYKYQAKFLRSGEVEHVFSGMFFVEGGVAVSRDSKRAELGGVRSDLASVRASRDDPSDSTEVINHQDDVVVWDRIDIVDAVDDGTTYLTLDSDWPANNRYWHVYNDGGDLSFVEDATTTPPGTPRVTFSRGDGNVGIGTTDPEMDLHISGDPFFDILLESNASTWWVTGAAGLDFALVDYSGGEIVYMMTLQDDELPPDSVRGLGIFERSPEARLHVGSPEEDGTAKILVTEENSTVTGRTLFELQNNGNVQFFFQNTDSGDLWQMSQLASVFQISTPSGQGKFRVRKGGGLQALRGSTTILDLSSTGDLTVKSVTETSSREAKKGFESVDGLSVLEKVAALPISEWSYKVDNPGVRHLGPMSEDFHAAFGLGKSDKGITSVDTSGVALAAIQGLNQKLEEKDARISELEQRLLELEEMVQARAEH